MTKRALPDWHRTMLKLFYCRNRKRYHVTGSWRRWKYWGRCMEKQSARLARIGGIK